MFNESEVFFICPHCMQKISMVIEEIYGGQSYIEDCEVCCRPIEITYKNNANGSPEIECKPAY